MQCSINLYCGLSDCHNFIAITIKGHCNFYKLKYRKFRFYKNFNAENFNHSVSMVAFHSIHIAEDI